MRDSQRSRLLAALLETMMQKGYQLATVGDVTRRAGVSRRTFYEHFPSKEAGFLAVFEIAVDRVLHKTNNAIVTVPESNWRRRIRLAIHTYLAALAAEPAAAWALYFETFTAGAVSDHPAPAMSRLADLFRGVQRGARRQDHNLPELPDGLFDLLIAGIAHHIRQTLRTDGAPALPGLEPLFVHAAQALFGTAMADNSTRQ